MEKLKVWGDFNGVWSDEKGTMLCLSHGETCRDENGSVVILEAGMQLTAFDEDADAAGNRDDLLANGIVEPSPDWLQQSHGSKWILRVDEKGIYSESEMNDSINSNK